ncbi:Asp23/Gls24 family envelope stress response protein [Microbacterium sp. NPDC089180]|uniref:Asp23/Gls24 family envelope stress response protein n=1 Tax=Microbacterium galbum TaxID=3075994 RepID=A0ABU3T5Z7_9MICO|nr:Asp23/Gls24 family envelope stress response protein [Microbacterium sp. KSW4-17]MDU0366796.1 Asp23/Gls24 family envelope stress response protein [Microbacterium sp. KSW4-17]
MTTIDATIDPPDLDAAASLAATAAGSVPGVHALGSLLGRASDAVRERVGLASTAPGVKIDTDRADSVTATISLVVDYPHKLHEVSDAVRTAVRTALEPLGRGRIDVDVVVTGVFGPFDRDVVAEAEEKADAATAVVREKAEAAGDRAREIAGEAKERADAASAAVREQTADAAAVVREKADDAAKALGDAKDAASDLAAGAAAAAGEFARQNAEATRREQAEADIDAADRVTEGLEPTDEGSALDSTDPVAESERADVRGVEERADVRDVVAEALEDAAVDIAIAADEVRADDETPAVDGVQSVVEDERPRS